MRKRLQIILPVVCLLFCIRAAGQTDSLLTPLTPVQYPIAFFATGSLGELYLVNTNNQLKKIDEKGDSAGVFNQVTRYGKLSYVESHNPWKTILFYKDFSTIIILDKFLNVTAKINLREKNILSASAVTMSYDNQLWVYDAQDFTLKKIDESGNEISRTADFRRLFEEAVVPSSMLDHNGSVYLYDPSNGLYVFDYYGGFKRKINQTGWVDFLVSGTTIYGIDSLQLYRYEGVMPLPKVFPLPSVLRGSSSVEAGKDGLYFLKEEKLYRLAFP